MATPPRYALSSHHYLQKRRLYTTISGLSPLEIKYSLVDKMIRYLCEHTPGLVNEVLSCDGHTPLTLAVATGNITAVETLLMLEADTTKPNSAGILPLTLAKTLVGNATEQTTKDLMEKIVELLTPAATQINYTLNTKKS